MITSIDGRLYLNMLRAGAQRLDANRTAVNDLNVFPIPDGDTGDNMFMTVNAGAAKATESELLGDVATDAARRMLLGARGNSGVILSRIFAGIAKGVEDAAALDTVGFIRAMELGVDEAYGAVSTPVEGTILTVYREGVEKTAQAKPEYGLVQGIQFLQERCLLYDDSGICFGECRRSREHERGRKNERGLLIIHHFHPLPLKFHVNGGFNNKL